MTRTYLDPGIDDWWLSYSDSRAIGLSHSEAVRLAQWELTFG